MEVSTVFMRLRLVTSLKCYLTIVFFFHFILFSFLLPIFLYFHVYSYLFCLFLFPSLWLFVVFFVIFFRSHLFLIFFCSTVSSGEWKEALKRPTQEINTYSSFNVACIYVWWRLYAGHFKSITLLFSIQCWSTSYNNLLTPPECLFSFFVSFSIPFHSSLLFHFIASSSPSNINETISRFVSLKLHKPRDYTQYNLNAVHAENTGNINIIFNVPYIYDMVFPYAVQWWIA